MKSTSTIRNLVSTVVVSIGSVIPVLAADGTQSSTLPAPGGAIGALIMWYVCSRRKAKEIGGWLLYFYVQLYVGVIIAAVIGLTSFQNYLPSTWAANPSLYPLFLLSSLPAPVILVIQVAVAEMLRRSRDYRYVRVLRTVLWIDLAATGVGLVIDSVQFQDSLALDALAFIWPAVWLPYFYWSRRVKRVFQTHDWVPVLSASASA